VVGGTSFENGGDSVEDPLFGLVSEFQPEPLPEVPLQPMPEIERALGIEPSADPVPEPEITINGNGGGLFDQDGDGEDSGTTRLLEPIPHEGEISVTASTEIGSTLREDWLSQAPSSGSTMEWPSHAMDGLDEVRQSPHPKPNRNFFPEPETTEWSVSEMRFKSK
jgi:hypothetical protein